MHDIIQHESLRVALGPLCYEFVAGDTWGSHAIDNLRAGVDCQGFAGKPTRLLRLMKLPLGPELHDASNACTLPASLIVKLAEGTPKKGWTVVGEETGIMTWLHQSTAETFVTFSPGLKGRAPIFVLPWPAILADLAARGGGIFHGGLAVRDGRGLLFAAPPGGGKTTALSRLPSPWQVLADDATLVWPAGDGFCASPLPTWSVLTGRNPAIAAIGTWRLAEQLPLAGILFLEKCAGLELARCQPIEVAPALYQALSEHPRVVANRGPLRQNLFHTACELARAMPTWRLRLDRTAAYWILLDRCLSME